MIYKKITQKHEHHLKPGVLRKSYKFLLRIWQSMFYC